MAQMGKAEIVARLAHKGQVDKGGTDYAEHLKAVAGMAVVHCLGSKDPKELALYAAVYEAAWLHDTVEDTPLSLNDLLELGFGLKVVEAVGLLTQDSRDSHADYIRRIRNAKGQTGTIARIVKRADLKHNADPSRMNGMPAEKLLERYKKALDILDGVVA